MSRRRKIDIYVDHDTELRSEAGINYALPLVVSAANSRQVATLQEKALVTFTYNLTGAQ